MCRLKRKEKRCEEIERGEDEELKETRMSTWSLIPRPARCPLRCPARAAAKYNKRNYLKTQSLKSSKGIANPAPCPPSLVPSSNSPIPNHKNTGHFSIPHLKHFRAPSSVTVPPSLHQCPTTLTYDASSTELLLLLFPTVS